TAVARIDTISPVRIDRDAGTALVDVLLGKARGLLLLLDVHDLLAAHRARVARAHADAHLIADRDGVDLGHRTGGSQAIVQHGHAAFEALALHRGPGAELVEGAVLLVHRGGHPFRDRLEPWLVGDLHRDLSANRDGLEPLAAHHGTHARAARDLVEVV